MGIPKNVVIVAGDVTIDWNLTRPERAHGAEDTWNPDDCTRACWQRGGAALMGDLIEAVAGDLHEAGRGDLAVRQTGAPREPVWPGDDRFNHSYAMWSVFPYGLWPPHDKERPAWRVQEFLGFDRSPTAPSRAPADWMRVEGDAGDPVLVVLDDGDLGFRDRAELWPMAVTDPSAVPWFLLKMSRPVAQGPLWQRLHREHADRLVVVITVEDLRRTEVQISRQLSWERAAQDLLWELIHNPLIDALSTCAHTIVSFGPAGALLLSRGGEPAAPPRCSLVFDPRVIEGMWEQEHPGRMIGSKSCLTAGIARQLMMAPSCPDLELGIRAGLAATRRLHLEGYAERGTPPADVRLAFPMEAVAGEIAGEGGPFAVVDVPHPGSATASTGVNAGGAHPDVGHEGPGWTILEDRYQGDLLGLARRIVVDGPTAVLRDVPLGQFGDLLTVDRQEIEAFRSIGSLVGEYARSGQAKPLSIAVLGPPGSGKSFGVTQVATALLPGRIDRPLEFNLSQFGSPEDLAGALHQVRDAVLRGRLPLVFWDEFDTALGGRPLGWLRYFLAPMQDGTFQEGQLTHPIGRCIFVFAGGTSERMEAFGADLDPEAFREAKGPDFVSRLRGYVDVLGPNPRGDRAPGDDPHFVIRRAILLRSMLTRSAPQLLHKDGGRARLDIDAGVLRAFLEIDRYRHGARSMESIIAMSQLAGQGEFERSSLPARAQLDLHVDGRAFLGLVQRLDLSGDLLERLAETAHEIYRDRFRASGYTWGPVLDVERHEAPTLAPYGELCEEDKEKNRENVRDIPNKLTHLGYAMVPARDDRIAFEFTPEELETLAAMEHERFVRAMVARGWRHGTRTDRARKVNETLVPWAELSEEQREKDRALVRGIPTILARAGYAVVRSGEPVKAET